MGRKIPGKKHKGVKDPIVQKAYRDEKLKNIINAPPVDPDEQETPKSLQKLSRLIKIAQSSNSNSNTFKKRKEKYKNRLVDMSKFTTKDAKISGMKNLNRPMPNLIQWEGETQQNFMKRVDEATQSVINEVEFEQQFGIQVRHNSEGKVESVEMAKPDEFEILYKQKRKEKDNRKKKFLKSNDNLEDDGSNQVLNRRQRQKAKRLAKMQEKYMESEEKLKFHDHVKFGEVVHQPPQFTVRPKNAGLINKPGVKGDLLLQKIINTNKAKVDKKRIQSVISLAARKKQDEVRNNVIQLYRQMKVNRRNNKI